jgi:hypothetical protein
MTKTIQKIKLEKKLKSYLFIEDANVFLVQLLKKQSSRIYKNYNINN